MTANKNNYKSLFTSSGCLKLETLQLHAVSSLSGMEKKVVESHLKECELCSDALEGLKLVKNPEQLSSVIRELKEDLINGLTARKVQAILKTNLFTNRILYFSAAATVLILVGVFAYLKHSKLLFKPQTTAILQENFTDKIPSVPIPKPEQEESKSEIGTTKPLTVERTKDKETNSTSVIEKVEKDNVRELKGHPVEPMKALEQTLRDTTEAAVNKSKWKTQLDEEPIGTKSIDIASNQPFEYYLGNVIIHAEKTMEQKSSRMALQASEQNKIMGGVAMQKEDNQDNSVTLASKEEKSGKRRSHTSQTSKSNIDQKPEHFFNAVDSMPEFPGGSSAMTDYLKKNLHYPAFAFKNHIEGTLTISFIVEETGKISSVTVLRGIGGGCDEEAIRTVNSMPDWLPGYINGKPVRVRFTLPITFQLN